MKLTVGKKYFYLTKLQEGLDYSTEQVLSRNKWAELTLYIDCLLYTSPSPRDGLLSRMPSSA